VLSPAQRLRQVNRRHVPIERQSSRSGWAYGAGQIGSVGRTACECFDQQLLLEARCASAGEHTEPATGPGGGREQPAPSGSTNPDPKRCTVKSFPRERLSDDAVPGWRLIGRPLTRRRRVSNCSMAASSTPFAGAARRLRASRLGSRQEAVARRSADPGVQTHEPFFDSSPWPCRASAAAAAYHDGEAASIAGVWDRRGRQLQVRALIYALIHAVSANQRREERDLHPSSRKTAARGFMSCCEDQASGG
jgi:hypothetical protein